MEKLAVSLVQTDLVWEDREANLRHFDVLLAPLIGQTDLILLPEMFTTGFSMAPERLAESVQGPTFEWMAGQASRTGAVVTGSYIVQEHGRYFNRLLWMEPDGRFQTYDKRHLFSLAGEHLHYSAGQERLIAEVKGWKVCPLICYDLRFPVWSRNTEGFDLLIYVANFPAQRSHAWKHLLLARAIENQCFTIGLNRVGTDGNGYYYSGDSCLIDYEGKLQAQISHQEHVATFRLEAAPMQEFRQKFPFLNDQDNFVIQNI